jgi:5'-nucleotidase
VRALVTNDDGIDSEGLRVLASVAVEAGLDVVVGAPHEERSGASASLMATRTDGRLLMHPVTVPELDVPAYGVEATPAYIAWVAIRGAFGEPVDLVLSGINKGPNTGRAILHSGTVGAALTGSTHGVPAMAVSMSAPAPEHWETAAAVARTTLLWLLDQPRTPAVLNVNVPDLPLSDLRGIVRAPLAGFGAVQADIAEIGEGFVTLTFSSIDVSSEPASDAALQLDGWATVTPLTGPSSLEGYSLDGLAGSRPDR